MFCFEVSTFRLSHKHSQTKKIEFSFNSYVGVSFMHACVRVCFLRPFSQMFQFKICVSLFLTACMCVCLWVCFDTQKTANLSLRILFTLAISFASILFCFVIVVTAWLSFIIQSCSIKLFLLWFSNRIHCEYGTGKTHSKNVFRETTHITHWTEWLVLQLHKSSTLKKHWIDDDLTLAEALPNWIELTREREQRNEKKKIN